MTSKSEYMYRVSNYAKKYCDVLRRYVDPAKTTRTRSRIDEKMRRNRGRHGDVIRWITRQAMLSKFEKEILAWRDLAST